MLADYLDDYCTRYQPYKGGRFCYEDGLLYRGLQLLHCRTGDDRWLAHLQRLAGPQIAADGTIRGYELTDYNIDNILSGRALLYLHQQTGDPRFLTAADTLVRQLQTHPRTLSGVFWHKLRYPWQIWLDGIYMGQPFRIAHAKLTGQTEPIADAVQQICKALDATLDPATGLYKHAYDEARTQSWADPASGQSATFWARAIGWLAMALVDIRALIGDEFAPLRAPTVALLDRISALRAPDGLWFQVMDQPDLAGNYQESSTSAMFTYALLRGAEQGLATPPAGLFDQLLRQALRPCAGGGYQMIDMCEVAGLGWYENRFRDGSAAYYLTEKRVADDVKGVGPLMMAAALNGL